MTAKAPQEDAVKVQYEQWVYPEPLSDLWDLKRRKIWNGGDPKNLGAAYWPDRRPSNKLRILVAGCGTYAAALYSLNNPEAIVVGVDFSAASLKHSQALKDKHELHNLSHHQCRIEDIQELRETFDLIDCSGVLHHLPDPEVGLKALAKVLSPDGVLYMMLYARYGRSGVYMLQEIFDILNLAQTRQDVALVRDTLARLHPDHQIQDYIARAGELIHDTAIVDTFLHPQDRAYSVQDCLDLVSAAGLVMQGWRDNFFYYPEGQIPADSPLFARIAALHEPDIWKAMELYNGKITNHYFFACHHEKNPASYSIDLSNDSFMDLIPIRRHDLNVGDTPDGKLSLQRPNQALLLIEGARAAIVRCADNRRSITECVRQAGINFQHAEETVNFCRSLFQQLWRLGYYHFISRAALE